MTQGRTLALTAALLCTSALVPAQTQELTGPPSLPYIAGAVYGAAYGMNCATGTPDNAAALQAAVNAAQALGRPSTSNGGGTLILPPGYCFVGSAISITNGLTIVGQGTGSATGSGNSGGTVIRTTSGTADVFAVAADAAVTFDNFSIDASVAKSAGAAISLAGTSASTANIGSRMTRMFFGANLWDGVVGNGAFGWTVTNSRFHSSIHNNITVAASSDFPDGTAAGIKITDNAFYNLTTGTTCNAVIEINGGGAVHIANNKAKGCGYGVLLNLIYGNTGTLLISNNGFEDTQHAHIAFKQTTSGKEYGNVTIVGNELSNLSGSFPNDEGCIFIGVGTPTTAPNWIRNVTISANVFNNSIAMTGGVIQINDGLGISIVGNSAWSGNQSGTPFLSVASPAASVHLDASNTYYGTANAGKWGTINWPSMTAPQMTRLFGGTTIAQNTSNFLSPGTVAPNAGVGPAAIESKPGVLRSLHVGVVSTPAAGQTYTFTAQIESAYGGGGGSLSALTCQIANPAVTCSDLTHAGAIVAGGAWALKVVTSATSGSTGVINASVGLDQ